MIWMANADQSLVIAQEAMEKFNIEKVSLT